MFLVSLRLVKVDQLIVFLQDLNTRKYLYKYYLKTDVKT